MHPRVLLLSERGIEAPKWQAAHYEFEDVIADVDDAALVAPPATRTTPATRLTGRVLRRAGRPDLLTEPRMRAVRVSGEYDLLFAVFHFPFDIAHLHRLLGWRNRCRRAVCLITELWSHEVEDSRPYLELLGRYDFDRIFLFNPNPKARVAEITGRPTSFLAMGVDAHRFSPYPHPPERTVDFYQFGRRSEATHAAALEMAERDGIFYLYDTVFNVPLPDFRAHRTLMGSIMKRTRYFFAHRTAQHLDRARGEQILASRYFEGIAGGAVVLGSAPEVPEYERCFGWPDSTIPIPYEAPHLREILAELETQPERLAAARRNNVVATLRRHDWVYRWAEVLEAVGLPPTERMTRRMAGLAALAERADAELGMVET